MTESEAAQWAALYRDEYELLIIEAHQDVWDSFLELELSNGYEAWKALPAHRRAIERYEAMHKRHMANQR